MQFQGFRNLRSIFPYFCVIALHEKFDFRIFRRDFRIISVFSQLEDGPNTYSGLSKHNFLAY